MPACVGPAAGRRPSVRTSRCANSQRSPVGDVAVAVATPVVDAVLGHHEEVARAVRFGRRHDVDHQVRHVVPDASGRSSRSRGRSPTPPKNARIASRPSHAARRPRPRARRRPRRARRTRRSGPSRRECVYGRDVYRGSPRAHQLPELHDGERSSQRSCRAVLRGLTADRGAEHVVEVALAGGSGTASRRRRRAGERRAAPGGVGSRRATTSTCWSVSNASTTSSNATRSPPRSGWVTRAWARKARRISSGSASMSTPSTARARSAVHGHLILEAPRSVLDRALATADPSAAPL